MRTPPKDQEDREELEKLNPEPWMIELLDLNPEHVFWGPHEDYMIGSDTYSSWESPVFVDGWSNFDWKLDNLTECVNFYFDIDREQRKCEACGQWTALGVQVSLVLWILHPRKGCSRGMEIKGVRREDLPEIFAFLRQAADRNAERFSKIPRNES